MAPEIFDSFQLTYPYGGQTFNHAPATIWLSFDNNSDDDMALTYVLVRRNN